MLQYRSYLLLPAQRWFVYLSVLTGLILNLMPHGYFFGLPDFLALILLFWAIRESQWIGLFWGFFMGLSMDIHYGSPLGEHALGYVLMIHSGLFLQKRIAMFNVWKQTIHVMPLLIGVDIISMFLRYWFFRTPLQMSLITQGLITGLCWPIAYIILLYPQRRAVNKDYTRPL
jgi:rod shape-determining protein MreD